jgi:hypothetical protein
VDENVCAAVVSLDKAETLGGVEPLDCTCIHNDLLSKQPLFFPRYFADLDRLFGRKSEEAKALLSDVTSNGR